MSARLHFTMDLLKNGTHVLITDVDNVYSRYVPLNGFLDEGYDAYHAFEMMYPVHVYKEFGFVICSGHQFIRSSPESIKFMEIVMKRCNSQKCDDQVIYNTVFFNDLKINWDNNVYPDNDQALRVNSTHVENGNLLVESVTGRSTVTNHTIKIWDRDFTWRVSVWNVTLAGVAREGPPHSRLPLVGAFLAKPSEPEELSSQQFILSEISVLLTNCLLFHRLSKNVVGRGNTRILSIDE